MADTVQRLLERSVAELEDLQVRGIFDREEIRSIVKARTASSAAASASSAPSSSRRAWPDASKEFACTSSVVASHALEV